jgi:hypothetical protein
MDESFEGMMRREFGDPDPQTARQHDQLVVQLANIDRVTQGLHLALQALLEMVDDVHPVAQRAGVTCFAAQMIASIIAGHPQSDQELQIAQSCRTLETVIRRALDQHDAET